jgi:hypothetical protein
LHFFFVEAFEISLSFAEEYVGFFEGGFEFWADEIEGGADVVAAGVDNFVGGFVDACDFNVFEQGVVDDGSGFDDCGDVEVGVVFFDEAHEEGVEYDFAGVVEDVEEVLGGFDLVEKAVGLVASEGCVGGGDEGLFDVAGQADAAVDEVAGSCDACGGVELVVVGAYGGFDVVEHCECELILFAFDVGVEVLDAGFFAEPVVHGAGVDGGVGEEFGVGDVAGDAFDEAFLDLEVVGGHGDDAVGGSQQTGVAHGACFHEDSLLIDAVFRVALQFVVFIILLRTDWPL